MTATENTTARPFEGQLRYRNGRLAARVESTHAVGDKLYYEIRRFVQSRRAFAKTTSTYAWRS